MMPVVIAGPTASGKSGLAIELALKHGGEIICADSRQFYAGMAIGTACPDDEDLAKVPHHGYSMLDPKSDKMDAGLFVEFANKKIREIRGRGKRPILVGGTGLYLRALYYGLSDVPPSDKAVAHEIRERGHTLGLDGLYADLKSIDPITASLIKPQDAYRIMRALEIFQITGKLPSELRSSFARGKAELGAHWIYKKPDKSSLLITIEKRVHNMFKKGLMDEARCLRERLSPLHWALDVMGYKEALQVIDHELTLKDAMERTLIRHRQYAKRQYTWFNKESFYRHIIS